MFKKIGVDGRGPNFEDYINIANQGGGKEPWISGN
jgi:hypothetical protein